MLSARKLTGTESALALLNARRLPGRLNTTEAAVLLGFQEHDITALIGAGLLSPLGKPAHNAPKYFAAVDIIELSQDREWLSRATRALAKYWLVKNSRKTPRAAVAKDTESEVSAVT